MLWARVRTARKDYHCDNCRAYFGIKKGEEYVESTIAPDHDDIGNETWWRMRECDDCAERYGRWPEAGSESEPGVPSDREYV